jgi:Flp pilus assembly pilin Flp
MTRHRKLKKQNQAGASMVEYALLAALIALIAIAGVRAFGKKARDLHCDNVAQFIQAEHGTQGEKGYFNESTGQCCYNNFFGETCF